MVDHTAWVAAKLSYAREAHIEMHDLMHSIQEHTHVASTFDGEAPALAFNAPQSRLTIGDRIWVPDESGMGRLSKVWCLSTSVQSLCAVKLLDERRIIVKVP
jgi:hypothetical protein